MKRGRGIPRRIAAAEPQKWSDSFPHMHGDRLLTVKEMKKA
jgi:hypothetical protein